SNGFAHKAPSAQQISVLPKKGVPCCGPRIGLGLWRCTLARNTPESTKIQIIPPKKGPLTLRHSGLFFRSAGIEGNALMGSGMIGFAVSIWQAAVHNSFSAYAFLAIAFPLL